MKTALTAEVVSTGGRSGSVSSPDGLLEIQLGNPLDPTSEQGGPNPELLFAAAYSACYHGAIVNAARRAGYAIENSKVRAVVNLIEVDDGGYTLEVELHAQIPGIPRGEVRRIMESAHLTCPYSRALRGDARVFLEVDELDALHPLTTHA